MPTIRISEELDSRIDETLAESGYDSRERLIKEALRSGLESIDTQEKSIGEVTELSSELQGRD